jgi:3,4-dihydroxy 2-butanone 4-phosphate synthase/GTP cyclohydrolase II
MSNTPLATVEQALADLRAGKMIIVIDEEHRENEGDLVMAAEKVTAEHINFMARFGRGLICLPMAGYLMDRLNIPLMVEEKANGTPFRTAFGVSIEAATGVATGISAADRAHTIQVAISDHATPRDIVMPGHVFPLRARVGGVLERPGHTESSVELAKLAGFKPAAVICEVLNENGAMARMPDLIAFAKKHQLHILSIKDLITYLNEQPAVSEVASATLPVNNCGVFTIKVFVSRSDGAQHVVLKSKKLPTKLPLVRLHSECLTGDLFGSARCDCGWQLHYALHKISAEGGALLYLRQEGRGIGLANKIKAYALQEQEGLDTVEANQRLGFAADQRDYRAAAHILQQLGMQKIRLLTNNPHKVAALEQQGIVVQREAIQTLSQAENSHYLRTKYEKLGHLLV